MASVITSAALYCTNSILFKNYVLDGWPYITSLQQDEVFEGLTND